MRNSADPMPEKPFPKGVPQPAIRALVGAGYDQLEQVAGASESALLQLHGVGPKAIRIITKALDDCGLMPLTPRANSERPKKLKMSTCDGVRTFNTFNALSPHEVRWRPVLPNCYEVAVRTRPLWATSIF